MSKVTEFFITLFLGPLGIHKFINKKIVLGIIYLLTCGLFGFGWAFDVIVSFINLFKKEKPIEVEEPIKQETTNNYRVITESKVINVYESTTRGNTNHNSNNRRNSNRYIGTYTLLDIETTGFSPVNDEIIEIAMLKVSRNKIIDTYHTLINPNTHIDSRATKVNHITDDMVKDAPTFKEVENEIVNFINDDVIVGHNVKRFDINFLNAKLSDPIDNSYIDTLELCKKLFPNLKHHRLSDMSKLLNLTENTHRALDDCNTTKELYDKLKMMKKNS